MSTVAIVRRETGGWKWPIIQFSYMLALAYFGALIANQLLS
jgi:ferrous iron transport protein B